MTPPTTPARILIVDDDNTTLALVRALLQIAGYTVTATDEPERALELCRERSFDLALLDVMMPEMSGFDLARALRREARTRTLPLIFLTGRGDESDRRIAYREVCAAALLVKPCDAEELLDTVAHVLAISRRDAG